MLGKRDQLVQERAPGRIIHTLGLAEALALGHIQGCRAGFTVQDLHPACCIGRIDERGPVAGVPEDRLEVGGLPGFELQGVSVRTVHPVMTHDCHVKRRVAEV